MKRIALGIQYDGSSWNGWQTQPDRNTVQDALESALQKFSRHETRTICAGRTDSGVHALEQVVHFDTAVTRERAAWVRGVNAFLPPSVAVRWAVEVPGLTESGSPSGERPDAALDANAFHARYSAIARNYHYVVYNHPIRSPLMRGRTGWVFRPLDAERMQHAAQHLVGRHDFSVFRAIECQARSPVREMQHIKIQRHGNLIVFNLGANAFLHHMVRNIVGSLIYVGNGSQAPEWIAELLACKDRSKAAPTFSPDGLYLSRVEYDSKWQLPHCESTLFPLSL